MNVQDRPQKPPTSTSALRASVVASLGVAGLLSLLGGCAVGPNYKAPEQHPPAAFHAGKSFGAEQIDREWWGSFQDAALSRLVAQSITNNPDLRIATSRLREARALLNETRFDQLPTLRNNNSYANSLGSVAARPGFSRNAREGELYHAGFDATWELDLFGSVRRSVEARRADLEAIESQRHDVLVSLVSEVARNYFELRGAQSELAVAQRNAENQRETVKLAAALREGGRGTALDVARATTQLNTTLAAIPPLETSIERSLNRIAVLLGLQPGTLAEDLRKPAPLPALDRWPNIGQPADLFRRRPDIRSAERNLAAATARIGLATADLFPHVSFSGSVALEGTTFSRMGQAGGDTWSFGPRISWAALDLGRVKQRVKAAGARAEGALAGYEKTVLGALEETENALVDYGRQQARLVSLKAAVTSATEAVALARQRYQDGVSDFLTVLDAERVQLQVQDAQAASETRTATALVSIYKALGGGWEAAEAASATNAPAVKR